MAEVLAALMVKRFCYCPEWAEDRTMNGILECCPFCGSKDVLVKTSLDGGMVTASEVSCGCGCYIGPFPSKEAAITKWNGRHNREFVTLRRAIYDSFIIKGSRLKEENLSLDDLCNLVREVGHDYAVRRITNKP